MTFLGFIDKVTWIGVNGQYPSRSPTSLVFLRIFTSTLCTYYLVHVDLFDVTEGQSEGWTMPLTASTSLAWVLYYHD